MKRLHKPLGRYFSDDAEIVADLMLENPVRNADELGLQVDGQLTALGKLSYIAALHLPDGRRVLGVLSHRTQAGASAELVLAIMAAEIGAPSVPYIYFPDKNAVFSPLPFDDAQDAHAISGDTSLNCLSRIFRNTCAETLGAMDAFLALVNKADDHLGNRVYSMVSGAAAIVDNENIRNKANSTEPRYRPTKRIARRRCLFGARFAKYWGAYKQMQGRIAAYPTDQFEALVEKVQGFMAGDPNEKAKAVERLDLVRRRFTKLHGVKPA